MGKGKFGLVDQSIMTDPTLSIEARAIYGILASYSNAKDRSSCPSIRTLLTVSGISKDRFYKHMGQLVDRGIVEKRPMMNGNLKCRNIYVLHDSIS